MTPEQLETFLLADTESELWHLEHPGVLSPAYQNIPLREYEGEKVYFFDFKNTLLSQNIAIVKEMCVKHGVSTDNLTRRFDG